MLALTIFSCKDDDSSSCTTDPNLTILENLVGTWEDDEDSVTFSSNGTGSTTDSFASFGNTNNGMDFLDFTYGATQEPGFDFEATWDFGPDGPIYSVTYRYKVIENLCDRIELEDGFGNNIILTR